MGPEFFQTVMGHRFYEATMPQLVKELERLNDNLEKLLKKDGTPEPAKPEQPKGKEGKT